MPGNPVKPDPDAPEKEHAPAPKTPDGSVSPKPKAKSAEREARLAKALRENLRRRKADASGREDRKDD